MNIPIWSDIIGAVKSIFSDTKDIVKEYIVDPDKQNEIIGRLDEVGSLVEEKIYIAELNTQTIKWVDALHKMGRQITNYLTLIVVGLLLWHGHEFTQWDAILLTGGNVAYQVIKGRGK